MLATSAILAAIYFSFFNNEVLASANVALDLGIMPTAGHSEVGIRSLTKDGPMLLRRGLEQDLNELPVPEADDVPHLVSSQGVPATSGHLDNTGGAGAGHQFTPRHSLPGAGSRHLPTKHQADEISQGGPSSKEPTSNTANFYMRVLARGEM